MKRFFSPLLTLALFLLSSFLIFSITRVMPLSPEEMLLSSRNLAHTPENIAILRSKWNLDDSLVQQYFSWMKGMIQGDWGNSLITGLSIKEEILRRLPYSLSLGFGSLVFSSIFAFFLGYLAALRGGFFDLLSRFLALFSQSVPIFISSLFVVYYLGVKFGWIQFFTGNPWISVGIGIMLLSFTSCGSLSRVARTHFLELKNLHYIKRLQSHGFKQSRTLLIHGTKPVLYALSGTIVSRFASVLGGSSVLEFTFAIPGINYFLIESIKNRDYNVIQSYLLLIMLWMLLVHFLFKRFHLSLERRLHS